MKPDGATDRGPAHGASGASGSARRLGEIFSNGAERAHPDHEDELRDLHAQIGQLTVERDFLSRGGSSDEPGRAPGDGCAEHAALIVSRPCDLLSISRSSLDPVAKGKNPENRVLIPTAGTADVFRGFCLGWPSVIFSPMKRIGRGAWPPWRFPGRNSPRLRREAGRPQDGPAARRMLAIALVREGQAPPSGYGATLRDGPVAGWIARR
ncbi:MAG: hypothetical protein FD149_785 [Rhodospirillaceae bacterium]|nr:MAG: hypothetical protein FD149_785 [Rhodospirillaceae bacterium]